MTRNDTASLLASNIAACPQVRAPDQIAIQCWHCACVNAVPDAWVPPTKLRPNTWFMTSATKPLAATANIPAEPSFRPASTRSARTCRGRRLCARTTARTDPNAEIAASCASRSVIPIASPAAADSRR